MFDYIINTFFYYFLALNVFTAFFNFLTKAGDNFILAGLAGTDLNMSMRKATHLHDDVKTYVVNSQSYYNGWNSAGMQCMISYEVIRMDMINLLKQFYGSYEMIEIP